MAYDFTAASSRYLSTSAAAVTQVPVTLACWFNNRSNAAVRCQVSVGNNTSGATSFHSVVTNSTAQGLNISAISNQGGGVLGSAANVGSPTSYALNTWNHLCGVFASTTSRTAYLNGALVATNSNNVNPTGINSVMIGARNANTIGQFAEGLVAEVGIWNAALTAAEIASLAAGMTCDKVRPQSLVFYAPLVRDLVDVKGGLTITNNNGATVANHPRVYA